MTPERLVIAADGGPCHDRRVETGEAAMSGDALDRPMALP
jgi:hypothetical protein